MHYSESLTVELWDYRSVELMVAQMDIPTVARMGYYWNTSLVAVMAMTKVDHWVRMSVNPMENDLDMMLVEGSGSSMGMKTVVTMVVLSEYC